MRLAISVEIPMSEFWQMTPKELNLIAENYREKQKQEFKDKLSLEYYNAMWTIQWLGEKSEQPRPLDEILDNLFKEKKIMTDEDMLNQVMVLNRLYGGEVKTCNP
ncbi:MAG TPA: hypothetical protein GXX72_07810 [Clostridiaceae bacterium]|nr:hypothetical protein [Clostridiaceae bacterium]